MNIYIEAIQIDNVIIPQVNSTKFLGIFIDQHLNWSEHINYISIKIAKSIGIISRISSLIPSRVRLNLYYSLIYPYLSYGNLVWAANYKSRIQRIIVLQKRIIYGLLPAYLLTLIPLQFLNNYWGYLF